MQRLATLVHISDLHFGPMDPQTQGSVVPAWLEKFCWLGGLRGHDGLSLQRLAAFVDSLSEKEDFLLVVTGDITSWGSDDQYHSAYNFLAGQLQPPVVKKLGLRAPDWKRRAVPGNHDHWPGTPTIWGEPKPFLHLAYQRTPYVSQPIVLNGGFKLRFFGIDTDADVHPKRLERFFAIGSFRCELEDLVRNLPANVKVQEPGEIRILLLHHSSLYRTSRLALRMSDSSRRALYDFVAQLGISVLLCGHTHIPNLEEFDVTYLTTSRKVFEACSGATTILTALPYDATSITGSYPQPCGWIANSLIVHRLYEENRRLRWHSQVYFESSQGFVIMSELPMGVKRCSCVFKSLHCPP